MDTTTAKNLHDYVMKTNTNEHHNRIINDLFNALFVEQQEGHVIDHTPNISDIMKLDLNQIQWSLIKRREGDYSQDDILDALKGLEFPKLLFNGTISTYSDFNGKQINAICLDYSKQTEPSSEIDRCDASRRWIEYAMKLEQQYAMDKKTIANLRAVITELSEVLYEVDADVRISITSSGLLELLQSNTDTTDNPF